MDEWLSHRSAKPSTAVRIRFGPQKTLLQMLVEGSFFFFILGLLQVLDIILLFIQGKLKPKAAIGVVGGGDCAAVELYGVLDNGKAETRATHSA